MHGRVIQGFFVGGEMRPMPGILRVPGAGPAAPVGRPSLAHRGGVPSEHAAAVQRATPGRPPAPARPGPPPAAFAGAVAQPRLAHPPQAQGTMDSFEVDPARLGLARSGGSPLPRAVQAKMEAAFGTDFSGVRVHIGPQAARIGAVAFTRGNDIYFAPGRYQPHSLQGQQLLGHELAHVVQQRQGRVRANSGGVSVVQDRALESEADRLGMRAAMSRAPAAPGRPFAPVPIQRRVVQRMAGYACDMCDRSFDTKQGLAIHKGKAHKGKKLLVVEDDEDVLSDWSNASLDEEGIRNAFSSSRNNNQFNNYQNRHDLELDFHSSKGLFEAVERIGGGNAPSANTHILVSLNGARVMANSSTVNGMRAMINRYKGDMLEAAQNIFGKKKHVHTEMYFIWVLAGGDPDKIKGCMAGMHLVVDKPICESCLPYVKLAGPALIDDNSDKEDRGDWDTWQNPFELKAIKQRPDNPFL